jgi:hypothetical protein
MSRLRSRIIGQHGAQRAAQAAWHPWGTADTPTELPCVVVQYWQGGSQVQVADVMYVPAGGGAVPVAATAPGRFGQVVLAGRV